MRPAIPLLNLYQHTKHLNPRPKNLIIFSNALVLLDFTTCADHQRLGLGKNLVVGLDCNSCSIAIQLGRAHGDDTLSMAALASKPSGVFFSTAARSMSPVARWHRQCSSLRMGDCVPFPHPGGPAKTHQYAMTNLQDKQGGEKRNGTARHGMAWHGWA